MDATGERPYAPQELVGLPSRDTGYQQVVWLKGADEATVASASVVGPNGPVETRHVDKATPGSQGWFSNAGVIIPVEPLKHYSRYRYDVVWQTADGQTIPTSSSFETKGQENSVQLETSSRRGTLTTRISTEGGDVAATIARAGGVTKPLALQRGGASTFSNVTRNLAPGGYTLCARSGSRASGYEVASQCRTATVSAYTHLALSKRLGKGRKAKLAVSSLAIGRRAVVRMTKYRRICRSGRGCYLKKSGRTRKKTSKLNRKTTRLKVPRAGKRGRVRVSVALKSYRKGQVRVAGSDTTRLYR